MYAIIRTGGKQYTVQPGDVLQVGKIDRDLGAEFDIGDVLLLGGETPVVGVPLVKNAKVTVVVTKQAKTRKVIVFKKKRRHSYRNFNTHRQEFTELFVKSITTPDGKTAKAEGEAVVKDMTALRAERIQTKQEEARARREAAVGGNAEAAPAKKAAPKKPAKKAAASKGKAKGAKKTGAKKKTAAKKTTKK